MGWRLPVAVSVNRNGWHSLYATMAWLTGCCCSGAVVFSMGCCCTYSTRKVLIEVLVEHVVVITNEGLNVVKPCEPN